MNNNTVSTSKNSNKTSINSRENAEKTREKPTRFDIWYPRVLLLFIAISIACNFIQLAGGFPPRMWQFGFVPVVACVLVSSLRTMIKEQCPNLTPLRIKRQKMNVIELVVKCIFAAVWIVSVALVAVKG